MTRDDIIRMAREAGELKCNCCLPYYEEVDIKGFEGFLKRFAAIVSAHEREKVAKWMVERSYATGHGDTIEDLLTEINWQAAEREREACRLIVLDNSDAEGICCTDDVLEAFRQRGEK
jgi:hypothetical protein